MIGKTLSHYQVVEKLGEGGMGVVYRALDTRLNRSVAVKVLLREAMADTERGRRFVQEARAASALNHPNIITVYDVGEATPLGPDAPGQSPVSFLVMEYVAGRTLDQTIGRKGLKLGEALKYAVQIADALATAHAAGIVHRDLKPANVMITDKGLVKVLDFGLAKLTEPVDMDGVTATRTANVEAAPPQTEEGTI
ncbi:MAG: serine/threonine protein kinase, partial [Acidobacteriota bacterium]|nr:serine/threonine protein kinase [Acidobacteriota bacterium]